MATGPAAARVRVHLGIDDNPVFAGIAHVTQRGGHTTVSFDYTAVSASGG